jgi:glycosyltransferase involved in cell wall biosynthesis
MTKICHLTIVSQKSIPRIIKESKSAINDGFSVYVVSPGKTYLSSDNIQYIGLNEPTSRLKRVLHTDKEIVRLAIETNSDIYQIHDPELLRFFSLLKRNNKKVIFDSHEFYSYQILHKPYIPKLLRPVISKSYQLYEDYIIRRIDYIIGVCTINGINPFSKFSNSMLIANYPYIDENLNISTNRENDKENILVYSGLLSPNRGIPQIVKASYVSKTNLVLCGPWMSESFEKEITTMDEFQYTKYLGILDNNELNELYKNSMIGLSTLLPVGQYHIVDTLPTKVYEYMSHGLPVIISDNPFFEAMNKETPFGISVDPSNVDEIARAINQLTSNRQLREYYGKNGISLFTNHYNWNVEGKKLLEVYKKLV